RGGDGVRETVEEARTRHRERVRERADRKARDRAVVLDDEQRAKVIAFVDHLKKPVGKRLVAAGLRGGRSKRAVRLKLPDNPAFGAVKGIPEDAIVAVVDGLLADGVLVGKGKKYPTVWLPAKRVRAARDPSEPRKAPSGGLRGALRDLRRKEAR